MAVYILITGKAIMNLNDAEFNDTDVNQSLMDSKT